MNRRVACLLTITLAIAASSCASHRHGKREARLAAGEESTATYWVPAGHVKSAVTDVLIGSSFHVKEEANLTSTRWRMVASQTVDTGADGRIARVVVEQGFWNDVVARVRVDSRLGSGKDVEDRAFAEDIQRQLASRLQDAAAAPGSR